MALHPKFPSSPYSILDPEIRWFPADEALRDTSTDKLMPPLVATAGRFRVKNRCIRASGAFPTRTSK
jgi:type III restriction enzyme